MDGFVLTSFLGDSDVHSSLETLVLWLQVQNSKLGTIPTAATSLSKLLLSDGASQIWGMHRIT